MADAPPKTRTVHLSAAAKETARKARVADKVLVGAGLKRAQNSNAEATKYRTYSKIHANPVKMNERSVKFQCQLCSF